MSTVEYQVTIIEGPTQGKIYPLNAPSLTIGRDPMSDIVLSDPEVSRYHARLTQTLEGGYKIEDMKSTNSTHIDGVRLGAEPMTLMSGQTILFGSTVELRYDTVDEGTGIAETIIYSPEEMDDVVSPMDDPVSAVDEDIYAPSLPQTSDGLVPPPPPMPDFIGEAAVETEILEEKRPFAANADVEEKRPFVANEGIIEPEIPPNNKNRNIAIGVSLTLFLLCCCCVIMPLVSYYWLGDLILEAAGLY